MMRKAILRRTAAGIATLFLVSILVFIGTSVLPGDVAQILLGQMATPETLAALRAKLGLDQPAHIRYFQWLGDLLTGDLGISKAGGSTISSIIQGRLSNTVWLAALVALIAIPVSLALGLLTAMYPGTRLDRTVTFCTLSLISVPEFLVATCLVLIFAVHLRWLPSIAYMSGNETGWQLIKAMAMPILTLVIVVSAQIIRMTRATVLNVMSSPYIEMAILKGVPRRRIILRHALRNAIGPIVNVIALNMAWLISGIVIVETIFAYPGLAKLMIDAVQIRDLPLVQAIAMIFCASYVVLIFVADMASILSNPRIRHPK
jgi:peptide/nickel transport system permease protein